MKSNPFLMCEQIVIIPVGFQKITRIDFVLKDCNGNPKQFLGYIEESHQEFGNLFTVEETTITDPNVINQIKLLLEI